MMLTKHFSIEELACHSDGGYQFAKGFLDALERLREDYGKPMKVNSCCRSEAHNKAIKGHIKSLHVYDNPYHPTGGCCAIDIGIADGAEKLAIAAVAIKAGWTVGVAKSFLHLDRRTEVLGFEQILYVY